MQRIPESPKTSDPKWAWLKYFKGHPNHAVLAIALVMAPAIIFACRF